MQAQGAMIEEAALSMGAGGWRIFRMVTLPNVRWGMLYGILLCNARAMGEFGAVSVVSGHIRGETNTLPLHVEILYNEYNFVGALPRHHCSPCSRCLRSHSRHCWKGAIRSCAADGPAKGQRSGATAGGAVSVPPATSPKYRLATWLSAGSLLIVLVALTVMALASSVVVSQFAARQALARSELAASSAREYFRRLGESNLIAARGMGTSAPRSGDHRRAVRVQKRSPCSAGAAAISGQAGVGAEGAAGRMMSACRTRQLVARTDSQ